MILFILMLKITRLLNILVFKRDKSNNKVNKFSINNDNKEFARKLRKLSKFLKLFKFKKLLKKDLLKINVKKARPSFLTFNAKTIFNYL